MNTVNKIIKAKTPLIDDVKAQVNSICNLIMENKKDIEFRCNDGAVIVNPVTLNFTYIGKFGSMVINAAISKKINNNDAKRIVNLATFILIYSMNNGGFNVITIK